MGTIMRARRRSATYKLFMSQTLGKTEEAFAGVWRFCHEGACCRSWVFFALDCYPEAWKRDCTLFRSVTNSTAWSAHAVQEFFRL